MPGQRPIRIVRARIAAPSATISVIVGCRRDSLLPLIIQAERREDGHGDKREHQRLHGDRIPHVGQDEANRQRHIHDRHEEQQQLRRCRRYAITAPAMNTAR